MDWIAKGAVPWNNVSITVRRLGAILLQEQDAQLATQSYTSAAMDA